MLNFDRIAATQAVHDPFSFLCAGPVLDEPALAAVTHDFPALNGPGLFPVDGLDYGQRFAKLVEELRQPRLQRLMEEKFDIDLSDKPLMITVRGFCQRKDGRIHVDSTDKVLTGLLYLNGPLWTDEGGRLRLLRGPDSLDDAIAEIPPHGGTMLVFRRGENSWHGHAPFEGPRRALMFNWMRSDAAWSKNVLRHKVSAFVKRGLAVGL